MQSGIEVDGPYAAAWRDLKFRRRLASFLFWGYMPLGGGLGMGLWALTKVEWLLYAVLLSWMVAWMWAQVRVFYFRCPRCRRYLLRESHFKFGRSKWDCGYCGLRYGSPSDPGDLEKSVEETAKRNRKWNIFRFVVVLPAIIFFVVGVNVFMFKGKAQVQAASLVAQGFMGNMQKGQFQTASRFTTPAFGATLASKSFQGRWKAFAAGQTFKGAPNFAAAKNFPRESVTLIFRLPRAASPPAGAKIEMLFIGNSWKVNGVKWSGQLGDLGPQLQRGYKPKPGVTPEPDGSYVFPSPE